MGCRALWGVLQSPRAWDMAGYVGCCELFAGSMGHWCCPMRGMQAAQSPPYSPLDKSMGGGGGERQGKKPTLRCRLCPFLASQRVPHAGISLTPCRQSGHPHWSHNHVQGQWIGGSPTRGCTEGPSPPRPRMLKQPGLPGASPSTSGHSLSPASIPVAGSPASPQPHLPGGEHGQGEAGAGAGSDSAQGQLLILALGPG